MLKVVRRYQSITIIDLESVLKQVCEPSGPRRTRGAVRVLFTLPAGVVMLLAAVRRRSRSAELSC